MRPAVVLAALLATAGPAAAAADRAHDVAVVDVGGAPRASHVTHTIYLNRCVGGCPVYRGTDNASTAHSSLIAHDTTISEFAYTDAIWDAVVACVRDSYLPYDVDVVTERPGGTDYIEAIVAGSPGEIGQPSTTLGYSPMANDCSPQHNWISFSFANIHGVDPTIELCATVAHEVGHVYGLDHVLPCKDPMTYANGCGVKHFLNVPMACGTDTARACQCSGDALNTHHQLLSELGPGGTPPPPEVTIPHPLDGDAVLDGFTVFGTVVEDRVVDRVELRLNGFPWLVTPGRTDLTTYSFTAPADLPDGVIDVEVRAYDDLQLEGGAQVTVTKGEPCTSAATCLDGQGCADGRCAWPTPTAQLGDACALDTDCASYRCESDGTSELCSQLCVVGDDATCGDTFTCVRAGDHGLCWPTALVPQPGGCCSTGGGGAGAGALAGLVGALLVTRGRGPRRAGRRSRT